MLHSSMLRMLVGNDCSETVDVVPQENTRLVDVDPQECKPIEASNSRPVVRD